MPTLVVVAHRLGASTGSPVAGLAPAASHGGVAAQPCSNVPSTKHRQLLLWALMCQRCVGWCQRYATCLACCMRMMGVVPCGRAGPGSCRDTFRFAAFHGLGRTHPAPPLTALRTTLPQPRTPANRQHPCVEIGVFEGRKIIWAPCPAPQHRTHAQRIHSYCPDLPATGFAHRPVTHCRILHATLPPSLHSAAPPQI